jgi:hypothetical protein
MASERGLCHCKGWYWYINVITYLLSKSMSSTRYFFQIVVGHVYIWYAFILRWKQELSISFVRVLSSQSGDLAVWLGDRFRVSR